MNNILLSCLSSIRSGLNKNSVLKVWLLRMETQIELKRKVEQNFDITDEEKDKKIIKIDNVHVDNAQDGGDVPVKKKRDKKLERKLRKEERKRMEFEKCGAGDEGSSAWINKKQKSEMKKKRRTLENIENSLDISDYYIENGLRKVYPYIHPYYSYCKRRWIGLTLKELFEREFRYSSSDIMETRIKNGHLKVNHEPASLDYVLKDNDFITHRMHRHEFPVLAVPVPVIHMDDDLLVIDKPPSMPVHPCGKYRLNTVTSILEKENLLKDIHIIHRLDRLTSGVMIMARNRSKAQNISERMRDRLMEKEYVCRVVGKFPDGIIEVDQPLETLSHKLGICIVAESGKPSKTTFERLNYNGKSSTVIAKPLTGRMHQIRVHLQWLGYPIVNDSFYNTDAWGPARGKNGEFGKSFDELINAVDLEHQRANHIIIRDGEKSFDPNDDPQRTEKDRIAIKALGHYLNQPGWTDKVREYDADKRALKEKAKELVDDCFDCQNPTHDPTPSEQMIYLHARRYKVNDEWTFQTEMPVWAQDSWTED